MLSEQGVLTFPDPECIVEVCARLRQLGQFEADYAGSKTPGLVRLRIVLPDGRAPVVHTAALRFVGPGRVTVGMPKADAVLRRLESAVEALRCTTAAAHGGPRATPVPPAARQEPPSHARNAGRPRATTPMGSATERPRVTTPTEGWTGRRRITTPIGASTERPRVTTPTEGWTGRRRITTPMGAPTERRRAVTPMGSPVPVTGRQRIEAPMGTGRHRVPTPSGVPRHGGAAPPVDAAGRPLTGSQLAVRRHTFLSGGIVRASRVEDLGALFGQPPTASALVSTSLAGLLRFIGANRVTGRLRIEGPCTKTFWVLEGSLGPSEASPPLPDEYIGQFAVKLMNLRSREPVERAVEEARRQGRRTGELLVERGVLKPAQVARILGAQSEARLLEAAGWSSARYEFSADRSRDNAPLLGNMHARVALARQLTARASPLELQARFGGIEMMFARLPQLPEVEDVALLGDPRTGATLRSAFSGAHRLHEAIQTCSLGRLPTMRLLVLLEAYGVLETAGNALLPPSGAERQEAARHLVAHARHQDPFRRLGAHPAMHIDQIHDAYSRALREFGPAGPWSEFAPTEAAEMASLVEDAFNDLRGGDSRRRLRRGVLGEDRARFVADLLVAQAHRLVASGHGQRARVVAEVALELADQPEAAALASGR